MIQQKVANLARILLLRIHKSQKPNNNLVAKARNPTKIWPLNQKQPPWKQINHQIKLHFSLIFCQKNTWKKKTF
jgi:hypothetical protein